MNFKIQIIALLLTSLCAAEPPAYPKQAISSQSYTREDVPLSYKHSAVHVYTMTNPSTTTPSTFYYQTTHAPELQQAVQYARVHLNHNEDEKMGSNNGLYTQVLIPTTTEGASYSYTNVIDTTTLRKDHLEPKTLGDEKKSIPFITGHNIDLNQVQRPRYITKEAAKYLYTSGRKSYNSDHPSQTVNNAPIPVVMTNMNSRLKTFYNVPRREIYVPQLCNKAVISYTHNRGELQLKNDKTLPQHPQYILFTKLPEVHNRNIDISTMYRNRRFPKQLP